MDKIEQFIRYINESKNIVFFGGAGVSTESGIPDFRSKDGLYNQNDVQFDKYSPEYLLSHSCLCRETRVFYKFYRQKLDARHCEPNITHKVLAKLEETGKLKAIVTQNIDGLHQKAGSRTVHEIHGTTYKNYCTKCGKRVGPDHIFDSKEPIPMCECGGVIRPDVVLYEEDLPWKVVNGALKTIRGADMLIVAGTLLSVYPAASYIYDFVGDHLVVINKERPDKITLGPNDLIIQDSLGNVFERVQKALDKIEPCV